MSMSAHYECVGWAESHKKKKEKKKITTTHSPIGVSVPFLPFVEEASAASRAAARFILFGGRRFMGVASEN
jgi:hypothetical protein